MPNMAIAVTAATSAARRELASTRREVDRFGTSTTTAGSNAERSRGRVSRFGGALGAAGKAFAPLAAAAAGAAILKFGADSVSAASRTQQAMGAIDSVFGKNAATVKRWASQAAGSVGLAKSEFGEMATVLGASLKNSGIEGYTEKTRGLITKGADLAATFGGSTKEAVEALGSALRGETDPIERYGITLKQSDINARLAAKGQADLTGKARQQAETQARLQLITERSKDTVGAFRRESGTLAGQQQRLSARFTNLKAVLGAKLIPVVSRVLGFFNRLMSGSTRTGTAARKLGQIYGNYVRPVFDAVKNAVGRAKTSFDRAGGSSKGLQRIGSALLKVAGFMAKMFGGALARAINVAATGFGTGAAIASRMADAIARVVSWAKSAVSWLGSLKDKAAGIGSIGGLFRSAPGTPSLARARGAGPMGGYGRSAAAINLTSAPRVTIAVDSHAMAKLFRVIVQDELRPRAGSAMI